MKKVKTILCSLALLFGAVAINSSMDNNAQVASANDSLFTHNFLAFYSEGATGTHGVEENYYYFNIENSTGTDWHVKLEKRIYVDRPYQYTAKWFFDTTSAGEVVANGQTYSAQVGENVVERNLHSDNAGDDNSINLELQLGRLPSNTTVKVYKLEIYSREAVTQQVELLDTYSFEGNVKGWGYDTISVSADELVVKSHIGESNDAWRDQLIIQTGVNLEPGRYNIYVDLESDHAKNIELCVGIDGDDAAFKKLYEQYGINLPANEKVTIGGSQGTTHDVTENLTNIHFRISLGHHANTAEQDTVKVSNLRIVKFESTYSDVRESSTLEFATTTYAFIRDWRNMRTAGGDRGICDQLDSETMTNLIARYDALSEEDRAIVDAAIDDNTTIGESIAYVKAYRASNSLNLAKDNLINNNNISLAVVLIVGLLGLVSVAGYYLAKKRKLA